jgi:Na+-transporting NADH:ubiquinone oxidoreductase subunit NqrB
MMLSSLLAYGVFGLHFELGAGRIAAVIGAALVTQAVCGRLWRLPRFDPLSALISGIGLCTLLRTDGPAPAVLAAVIAIASKFVLRIGGKHLYNPTNLALVIMLVTGAGWISPGQYGHLAFVALLMVCLGLTVVCKAGRFDVTLAFLAVYAAILFGRSLWMGEPLRIPLHRLQSGLLLQFAFNMISDPRTTPDSRAGRLLFGALVAIGAGFVQFGLFRTNGPVWSLAACTLFAPLIDRWLPGPRHQWNPAATNGGPATAGITPRRIVLTATAGAPSQGDLHEAPVSASVHAPSVPAPGPGDVPAAAARGPLARHRP